MAVRAAMAMRDEGRRESRPDLIELAEKSAAPVYVLSILMNFGWRRGTARPGLRRVPSGHIHRYLVPTDIVNRYFHCLPVGEKMFCTIRGPLPRHHEISSDA